MDSDTVATAAPVGAAPSSVVITPPQTVLGENSAGVVAGRRRAGNHGVDSADNFENNPVDRRQLVLPAHSQRREPGTVPGQVARLVAAGCSAHLTGAAGATAPHLANSARPFRRSVVRRAVPVAGSPGR